MVWGASCLPGCCHYYLKQGPLDKHNYISCSCNNGKPQGRNSKAEKKHAVIALLFIVIAIAVIAGGKGLQDITACVKTFGAMKTDLSFQGRTLYYRAAMEGVKDHPVFGIGFDSFRLIYPKYRPKEDNRISPDITPTLVHNGYLQMALFNGIPAVIIYAALLLTAMIALFKVYRDSKDINRRLLAAAFFASVMGYAVQDLLGWQEISLTPFFWIILGLSVALYITDRNQTYYGKGCRVAGAIPAGIFSLMLLVNLMNTGDELQANSLLWASGTTSAGNRWNLIEENISRALKNTPKNYYYKDAAGRAYLNRLKLTGSGEVYRKGSELFEQAFSDNPYDVYYLIHRIELDIAALSSGLITRPSIFAEDAAKRILHMDSNNAAVYETLSRLRHGERRFPEALSFLEEAKDLRPGTRIHHVIEGDIKRQMKDFDGALEAYRNALSMPGKAGYSDQEWIDVKRRISLLMQEKRQIR